MVTGCFEKGPPRDRVLALPYFFFEKTMIKRSFESKTKDLSC